LEGYNTLTTNQKSSIMSLKGSNTTADYLPWKEMQLLVQQLERDEEYPFALLVAIGSYTGLRISDLLPLKWEAVIDQNNLEVQEKKTGKQRNIHLNKELQAILHRIHQTRAVSINESIFKSREGRVYSLQYINRKLKQLNIHYELNIHFSTHTFRKTFGRRIWDKNNNSEKSLILLGQIFNHTSVAITKRYLGIREQEIKNVYMSL